MPLEKLSKAEVAALTRRGPATDPIVAEYAAFLGRLPIGDGGRAIVAREGATRFTVRSRIRKAADAAGVHVKFLRSSPDVVIFEVVDAANAPKRPGRKPKTAA
jgi:hypothetical protein